MSEKAPIDFYFEFASPYGYFASLTIDELAARYDRRVNWRPFMLGAAFKVTNSAPNMTIPMKGDYLRTDVERCAKFMGIELTEPEVSPMNSLAAMRSFYWLTDHAPTKAVPLARAGYKAHWGEGRDMGPMEAVAELAADLGIDGPALTEAVREPAVKDRLKRETEAAIARGAFGSPFIFVDDEPYWGHDRMSYIERHLQTGSP